MSRPCVICGVSLPERSRSDRRTCSARCRVALSRRLRPRNPGSGGDRGDEEDAEDHPGEGGGEGVEEAGHA